MSKKLKELLDLWVEDWTVKLVVIVFALFCMVIGAMLADTFSGSPADRQASRKEDMFIRCLDKAGRMSADSAVVEQCRKTTDAFYPAIIHNP